VRERDRKEERSEPQQGVQQQRAMQLQQDHQPDYDSPRIILALIPENNPVPWVVINAVFLLWSIATGFIILETFGPKERLYGTHYYLIWCASACLVWTFEVALQIWHIHSHKKDVSWPWWQVIELVLAVYWSGESLYLMIFHWYRPDAEVGWELLDVGVSIPAYGYVLYETLKMAQSKREGGMMPSGPEQDTYTAIV